LNLKAFKGNRGLSCTELITLEQQKQTKAARDALMDAMVTGIGVTRIDPADFYKGERDE
jgi:hypothetical protein